MPPSTDEPHAPTIAAPSISVKSGRPLCFDRLTPFGSTDSLDNPTQRCAKDSGLSSCRKTKPLKFYVLVGDPIGCLAKGKTQNLNGLVPPTATTEFYTFLSILQH